MIVEGAPAAALDVDVHDYRGQRGQVFYAYTRQPLVPPTVRFEVAVLGRILGYTPHHEAVPWMVPLDVPDQGLSPDALVRAYNIGPLRAVGPYHAFGPDFGPGLPSGANLQIAQDLGKYVNSFTWKGDPPR